MNYIRIELDDGTQAYQEVHNGTVMRLTDMGGNTLVSQLGSRVIDVSPEQPSWALSDSIESPILSSMLVTKLAFMTRFTDEELERIYTTAKSVVKIEVCLEKLKLTTGDIDLSDSRTIGGVYGLESAGLIAPGLAAEILK